MLQPQLHSSYFSTQLSFIFHHLFKGRLMFVTSIVWVHNSCLGFWLSQIFSDRCTYFTLLWIRVSAKCINCICVCQHISRQVPRSVLLLLFFFFCRLEFYFYKQFEGGKCFIGQNEKLNWGSTTRDFTQRVIIISAKCCFLSLASSHLKRSIPILHIEV